jgi:hypothetical protein
MERPTYTAPVAVERGTIPEGTMRKSGIFRGGERLKPPFFFAVKFFLLVHGGYETLPLPFDRKIIGSQVGA